MAENSSVTLLQRVRTASNATTGWSLVQTSGRRSRSQFWCYSPAQIGASASRCRPAPRPGPACARLTSTSVRFPEHRRALTWQPRLPSARLHESLLVRRAWPLQPNSCAGQPRRRPASSRQRYAARPPLQPHTSALRLRSGRLRRHENGVVVINTTQLLTSPRSRPAAPRVARME
jgi:hypothetical protein